MKNIKRALALLLCLVMVLSCVPTHSLAASDVANVYMKLSTHQVDVDQTFTITVSYEAMKVSSFGAPLSYDRDLVEFVSAVACDPDYPDEFGLCTKRGFVPGKISTPDEAYEISQVGFVVSGTDSVSYTDCDLYTATFRAIAPGTVTFTLREDSDGPDGFKGTAATETVTIIGSTEPAPPECEHTETELVSNGDGTHNVVCVACGESTQTNVTCSGTVVGDHTSDVKCACGYTVTAGTAHKDENPKDHVCDFDGCNFAMGEHKSNAAYPCVDGICEYCRKTVSATTTHKDENPKDHKCDYGCGTDIGEHKSNAAYPCLDGTCEHCGEPIRATTGHSYTPGTPVWSDNNTKCTVTGTCACGATTTAVTTNIKTQVTTEADCQTPEGTTHTATFVEPWVGNMTTGSTGNTNPDKHPEEFIDTKTETVTEADCENAATFRDIEYCTKCGKTISTGEPYSSGDPLYHNWNTPTYSWSADGKTCTATRICENNEEHKEEETVTGTPSVTTVADCQTAEVVTYTADFTSDWAEDQTMEVTGDTNPNKHVGTPTVSYRCNDDYTHTEVSAYACGHSVDGATTDCADGDDADELCDACGNNLHVHTHDLYDYINYESHEIFCDCGETLGVVEHELGEDGSCVCGAIELRVGFEFADFEGNDDPIEGHEQRSFWVMPNQDLILNVSPTNRYGYVSYYIADWDDESDDAPYEAGIIDEQFKVSTDWYDAEWLYISVMGVSCQTIDLNGGSVVNPDDWGEDYDPEENVIFLYGNETGHWNLSWYTEESEEIVREGYKLIGFKRDGEFHDVNEDIYGKAGDETLTLVWECNHDADIHDYSYTYVDSSTHTVECECSETIATVAHEHGEDGSCVCGAFLVTMDYNGGADKLNPGEPSDSWYTMEHTLQWNDEFCKDVYTKDGYVFAGFASDAAGENLLPYGTVFQSSTTFYVAWECNHDEAFHEYSYSDNNNGTHTVKCECDETIETVNHDYTTGDADHTCACGKVEEFTLTVNVWATGELVELTVPYGANLLDVLAAAEAADEIPALDESIRVNNANQNGVLSPCQYIYSVGEAGDLSWAVIDENTTMPAKNFEINQDYNQNGWVFTDLDDGRVGAEYCDLEDGYLTGWNYIAEDYDDVEGGAWYYFYEGTGVWEGWYFRAEGLTRAPYPSEEINGNTYAPDADAVASDPDFIDATEARFMFGDDGKFQYDARGIVDNSKLVNGMLAWHPGMVEIPGSSSYHYFLGNEEIGGNIGADGDVWVTRIAEDLDREFVLGGIYTFEDSKLCEYTGITAVGGKLRFYGSEGADENRLMAGNGLTKVGENFIYVRSNGELVVNADYYVPTNDKGIVPGTYHFDENGFLVNPELTTKNGIVAENGGLFFYENGKIAYNKGLIQYNGGIIYVRSNGQLAVGEYYVTNLANFNGNDVKYGDKVTFGDDGYMVAAKNGIVDGMYYIDNQIAYNAGVVQLENGKYIYVKSNGTVVMNTNYWITNVGDTGVVAKLYSFDANGYFAPEFAADQKDGIVDGYYYVDGKIAYGAGLIYLEDEGCYIYVRSNGQLATGIYWPTATNGYDFSGRYDFGADGKLYI